MNREQMEREATVVRMLLIGAVLLHFVAGIGAALCGGAS